MKVYPSLVAMELDGAMTIQEIKEIRATVRPTEQEYFDAHSVAIADILLEEVDRQAKIIEDIEQSYFRLVDKYNSRADQLLGYQNKLATALGALERIAHCSPWHDEVHAKLLVETASAALERIKG